MTGLLERISLKRRVRESRVYLPVSAAVASARRRRTRQRFLAGLRPDDLFLVGHPKSGNTWLAYLLAILRERDREGRVTLRNVGRFVPVIHGRDHAVASHAGLGPRRIFRNEWPVHPELYPRTLYVVRDPRAVVVSMFHMFGVLHPEDPRDIEAFVDEYLRYGCIRRWEPRLERWDRQVAAWGERAAAGGRVHVLRYEDLVAQPERTLRAAAVFADLPREDALVAHALERGRFDAMRAEEERGGAEAYPGHLAARGRFVRRGRVDGWREELPPATAERIARSFEGEMHALGYEA